MIIMRSVKSWVRSCNSGGVPFVLLFVILLQTRAGWSQELAPPKLDEEFGKQEKIYRSQGADVPSGYVIGRGLSEYAELLPSGFCDALAKLGSSDRWLDIGAGSGQAILDYYASEAAPSQKCSGSAQKARAVALSIEDRRTDKWREQAKDKLGILYLTELEDAVGRPERVCSWLKKTACTQVTCESKFNDKGTTE